jgi:hypothetical protein
MRCQVYFHTVKNMSAFSLDTQSRQLRKRTRKTTKVVLFGHWLLWPTTWTLQRMDKAFGEPRTFEWAVKVRWSRWPSLWSITAIPTNVKVQWNWTLFLNSCICKVMCDREVSIVVTINLVVLFNRGSWTRASIALSWQRSQGWPPEGIVQSGSVM